MKHAILFVIGIVVGMGCATKKTGGDDREAWPLTQCPPPPAPDQGTTAKDKLDEVTSIAMALPQPEKTADSEYCAVKAQQVQMLQPMDENVASGHAEAANVAAKAGNWGTCRNELDQIH